MPHNSETSRTRRRPGRVPTLIVAFAALVIAAAVLLVFTGGSQVGATWDERVHALMLDTYFTTGWYVGPDWLVNGQLDEFTGKWPYFVYAPVASLVAHFFAAVTGAEPWGGFSDSASAHAARHIGTAVMALLGIVGVFGIVRVITRSWRWAVLGAAVLASVPMWVGHGMFNIKDLPVGTGYTLATLGFVCVLRRDYGSRRWLRLLAWMSVVVGVFLAVGTRPASGLPMALTGLAIAGIGVVLLFLRRRRPYLSNWSLGARVIDSVGPLILAYLALVVVYPNGFINPFRLAKESLLISGRFPVSDPELTNGQWLAQPPPWFYLPTWFGAQLTLLVLAGCALFVVAWVIWLVRLVRQHPRTGAGIERVVLPLPVVGQALILPLLAIAVHSTIYNGVRQFIFVVPAVAVLATLGIRALVGWLGQRRGVSILVWVVVCIGLVMPVIDQVRLFPYTYAYFNELAGLKPINGNWSTDYWRASGREFVQIIPPGQTSCVLVDAKHPLRPCDADASFAPFWDDRGARAIPGTLEGNQYWLVRQNGGELATPEGCTLHDEFTRPLRNQQIIIGQVFRCDLPVG